MTKLEKLKAALDAADAAYETAADAAADAALDADYAYYAALAAYRKELDKQNV